VTKAWLLAGGLLGLLCVAPVDAQTQRFASYPDSARLITDDIGRFWNVLDTTTPDSLAVVLEREYLARGTEGLQGFVPNRIRSAAALAATISTRRERYEEIREFSMNLPAAERAVRAPLYALKYLYPDAVFPDIYFLIGRLSSGGTVSDVGLLIGTEMFRNSDGLRSIVAHELIHFQQRESGQWAAAEASPTLLVVAILEGSADFIAELISGVRGNRAAQEYGRANERTLWEEFEPQMHAKDLGTWFSVDPPGERPADLGYFVGYRIAESYYNAAADKRKAVQDILTTTGFTELLGKSGYRPW
jgi:hypothetical protein